MTYDHWKSTNHADEFLGPEPEEHDMPRETYDPKCWELAGHFLDDHVAKDAPERGAVQNELAINIQRAIEEFLEDNAPSGGFSKGGATYGEIKNDL
jgi:hypothetical protein